jgi:GTP-binding protein
MNLLKTKATIVLVGKTNVGKSTLFNRLSNKRISITHETPGATRDCVTREAYFYGHEVIVADSGGIEEDDGSNPFQTLVSERVYNFIEQKADIVLFVVSAKDGICVQDREIAQMVRRFAKPVIQVINKVDHENQSDGARDCMKFGFQDPVLVSAAQVTGLSDLRLRILQELDLKPKTEEPEEPALRLIDCDSEEEDNDEPDLSRVCIAVVGKPNSGKSTFVNAILNEDRVMTSEIPGTTVDAIDTHLVYRNKDICLIDTAGIRRQRSISEEVEKMAVARSLCAIDRAQVVVMMISAQEGVSEQDKKVAGIIFEKKKACIIAINKWDEETKSDKNRDKFLDKLRFDLPFLNFAPVLFLSAKYGEKIFDILDRALHISPRYLKRINTSRLNRALEKAQLGHPAPVINGRRMKMYFATQTESAPPTFAISCSHPNDIHFSYKRYLMNFLRTELELDEIPLRLIFKKKSEIRYGQS